MTGERALVPMDAAYVAALGVATYIFARLEWDAVYCCEKIQPGFVCTVSNKTAGQIAADFRAIAPKVADPIVRQETLNGAAAFTRLVGVRNSLIHANPCTAPTGEQRLNRHGSIIDHSDIERASDEFAACSRVLNDLFHHKL